MYLVQFFEVTGDSVDFRELIGPLYVPEEVMEWAL